MDNLWFGGNMFDRGDMVLLWCRYDHGSMYSKLLRHMDHENVTHSDTTVGRMLVGKKCDLDNIRAVVNCKDELAQYYLMDCLIQPTVDIKTVLSLLMERLSSYAASSPEVLPEFLQVEAFSKLSSAIGKVIVTSLTLSNYPRVMDHLDNGTNKVEVLFELIKGLIKDEVFVSSKLIENSQEKGQNGNFDILPANETVEDCGMIIQEEVKIHS
ncbi:hypothetical protein LXL04_036947 [Taraxacum kok-saghyz]